MSLISKSARVLANHRTKLAREKYLHQRMLTPDRVNLVIPATHFDISDRNFVEIVFWPRALADQPVKSVRAFIPKQEITLIVELKSPDALPALGYKTKAD